jgi:hypothetical protein
MAEYVLDENIIKFAAKVMNAEGNLDISCLALMTDIVRRCDFIHCSKPLLEKYWKKLKELENTTHSAAAVAKMVEIMLTKGAIKFKDYTPRLKDIADEKEIPPDDLFLIRLVVHTGATLITADCRLKARLDEKNLTTKYRISIQKPWGQHLVEK